MMFFLSPVGNYLSPVGKVKCRATNLIYGSVSSENYKKYISICNTVQELVRLAPVLWWCLVPISYDSIGPLCTMAVITTYFLYSTKNHPNIYQLSNLSIFVYEYLCSRIESNEILAKPWIQVWTQFFCWKWKIRVSSFKIRWVPLWHPWAIWDIQGQRLYRGQNSSLCKYC